MSTRTITVDTPETAHTFPLAPESYFGGAIERKVTETALQGLVRAGWNVAPYFNTPAGFTVRSWSAWVPE